MLEIKITNLERVSNELNKRKGEIEKESDKLVRDVTDIVHRWVQKEAPRRTGRLKAGVSKGISGTKGHVFVSKNVRYADAVLDGTKPHLILPKHKKALFWPGAAYPVRSVHHPGTKSNPFFDTAYDSMQSEVESRIEIFSEWIVS